MAEGWARHLKSDLIEAYSAGIEKYKLDPLAVQVMAEAGVDISRHTSKTVDDLPDIKFDYIVTVCDNARELCPFFPGTAKIIHRGFDDPARLAMNARTAEEILLHYRGVRNQIRAFVETIPDILITSK